MLAGPFKLKLGKQLIYPTGLNAANSTTYRALECDQFGRTCDLISQGCD